MSYHENLDRPSVLSDFEFLGKLGQGSFGIVFKVKRKIDKSIYVLKQINIAQMNPRMRKEALNEVRILSSLDGPYIVKYFESFIEKNYLNIVMEYCEGGDLANYIKAQSKPLTENKAWKFFIQTCIGLAYIHSKKILHRDIKSMNIFLSKQEEVRIGDLGVAKVLAETGKFAHTMIGTPYYLSPEMCEEKPYNAKSDIWALGCVLYEMCTKKHPFEATNQAALILKIISGKYAPIPSTYSLEMIEVLNLCLCRDYKKRPYAGTLLKRPDLKSKAKALGIALEEEGEQTEASEVDKKIIPPLKEKQLSEKSQKGSESNLQRLGVDKKERSPLPGLSPSNNERVIVPLSNNGLHKRGASKNQASEDIRPKSPISNANLPLPKKISGRDDQISVKQTPSEKEKSPLLPKPSPIQNQDRNVKRIRKGAPQVLGRQAMNAGNPRVIPKLDNESLEVKQMEIKPKSKSPLSRRVSEEVKTPPVYGHAENKKPKTPTEQKEKPRAQVEKEKEEAEEMRRNLENELFGKPKSGHEDENKYSQISFVKVEDVLQKDFEWTPEKQIDLSYSQTNKENDVPTTTIPQSSGIDTDFEEDVETEVKWKIVEEEKLPEPKVVVHNVQQKHFEADEIPVFHVEKDIPILQVNAMSPEVHHYNDDDDEEHEAWDSEEDEKAYYEDQFEDEENKKGKHHDEQEEEYGEDFESEGENESEEELTEKRDVLIKNMEKAKKEKEIVEQLLKDRSSSCIKLIGQQAFEEIMGFLRRKIGEDENEKEIDDFLRSKVGKQISEAQMSFIMMKILPFEIKKCRLEDDIRGYIFDLQ